MSDRTIKKPLIMDIDEAENKLINSVNAVISEYSLPAYILEMIFEKIHHQIRESAKTELVTVKNEYARKCAETANEEVKT